MYSYHVFMSMLVGICPIYGVLGYAKSKGLLTLLTPNGSAPDNDITLSIMIKEPKVLLHVESRPLTVPP